MNSYDHDRYSERSSLHDVRYHAPPQFPRAFSSRESIMRTDANCCFGRAGNPTGGARRDRTDDLLLAKQALSQLSYGPVVRCWLASRSSRKAPRLRFSSYAGQPCARFRERRLVGLGRFELPTSRLSSARSNQLSYKPMIPCEDHPLGPAASSPTASAGDDAGTRNATEHGAGLVHEERET
jgi:hypothetical protein